MKTRPSSLIALGCLLLPIAVFWYVFVQYAVDVPMWDDFVLVDFILRLHTQPTTLGEKLRLLLAQHNAHRIAYDRLVTYLIYLFTGHMNFKGMMLVGNLSLMALLWLWYRASRRAGLSLWYLVPVPYWLLSIQGYENTFWAMASLQNYTVIALVFGSVYWLINGSIAWAAGLAVMATFTSGNGQMAFLIGLLILAYQRAAWRRWLAWLGVMGLALAGYFWQYRSFPPEILSVQFIINFLAFNGAAFASESPSVLLPVGVGIVLTSWLAAGFVRWIALPLWAKTPAATPFVQFLYAGVAFAMGSALLVAMAHRSDTPMAETLVSRYKIYSHLLLVSSYWVALLWLRPTLRRWVLGVALMGGGLFQLYSYYGSWGSLTYRRQDATLTAFNYRHNGTTLMGISHAKSLDSLYRLLESEGIYRLPEYVTPPTQTLQDPTLRLDWQQTTQKLLYFAPEVPTLLVRQNDLDLSPTLPNDGVFVVMRSARASYVFNVRRFRANKKRFLSSGEVFREGFETEIHEPLLPPDTYQLGVLEILNGRSTLRLSSQRVVLKPWSRSIR